jgi:hypothetical protein
MLMDSVYFNDFIKPESSSDGLMQGTIPGSDRSFLYENGLIDDPYFGRNLDRTRWVENHAWAFRKRFTLPEKWRKSLPEAAVPESLPGTGTATPVSAYCANSNKPMSNRSSGHCSTPVILNVSNAAVIPA